MKIGPKTGLMLQKIHLKSWENAVFGLTSIYNICYNNLHGKNAKGAMTAEVTEIHPGKGDREFRASIIQHIGWNTEFSWCNATTAFSRCETATITLAVRKRTPPLYHSASFMVRDRFALSRHFFAKRQEKHIRSGFECSVIHLHTLMGLESP